MVARLDASRGNRLLGRHLSASAAASISTPSLFTLLDRRNVAQVEPVRSRRRFT
jgi:hypothetical protein